MEMQLLVSITARGIEPEPGVPVHVEVRDTSIADAGSVIVASATGEVATGPPRSAGAHASRGFDERVPLAQLLLDLPDEGSPQDWSVWAHVQTAGGGGLQRGDWITVQSYPVSLAGVGESDAGGSVPAIEVEVAQI
jgi:hypothetical protein